MTPGPQDADVRAARRRWATRRSRSASRRRSQTDFDFVRQLIEGDHIPDDVVIQVLTQAREPLIERTYEAIAGAPQAIVHLYNSTSTLQRRVVFGLDRDGIKDIATHGAQLCLQVRREPARAPRSTSSTPPSPTPAPSSSSPSRSATPSSTCGSRRRTARRSSTCRPPSRWPRPTSTPTRSSGCTATSRAATRSSCRCTRTTTAAPPSPRPSWASWPAPTASRAACSATASAPATSAWSRSGMNLFSQGIDPQIDFRDIDEIRRTVEYCNQLPVQRAPPVRRRPGLHRVLRLAPGRDQQGPRRRCSATPTRPAWPIDDFRWEVPYLPIDPKDVGRTYEAVIRVNSQSGKGGVAYIMKTEHKLELPRRLQIEFSAVVQQVTDCEGGEVSPPAMWDYFQDEYLPNPAAPWGRFALRAIAQDSDGRRRRRNVRVVIADRGTEVEIAGIGNGPIAAFCDALAAYGVDVRVLDYNEHAMSSGGDAVAASYLECAVGGRVLWGVGIDPSIVTVVAQGRRVGAVNRAERDGSETADRSSTQARRTRPGSPAREPGARRVRHLAVGGGGLAWRHAEHPSAVHHHRPPRRGGRAVGASPPSGARRSTRCSRRAARGHERRALGLDGRRGRAAGVRRARAGRGHARRAERRVRAPARRRDHRRRAVARALRSSPARARASLAGLTGTGTIEHTEAGAHLDLDYAAAPTCARPERGEPSASQRGGAPSRGRGPMPARGCGRGVSRPASTRCTQAQASATVSRSGRIGQAPLERRARRRCVCRAYISSSSRHPDRQLGPGLEPRARPRSRRRPRRARRRTPVTSTQARSTSPMRREAHRATRRRPARCGPAPPASSPRSRGRGRRRTGCRGRGGPGASTRPPRAMRRSHHGRRPTFSRGPRMSPARRCTTRSAPSSRSRASSAPRLSAGTRWRPRPGRRRRPRPTRRRPSGMRPGVHRAARHVDPSVDLVAERARRVADDVRRTRPRVDDEVEPLAGERVERTRLRAVERDRRDAVVRRVRQAAVRDRHVPAARDRLRHDRVTDELRATEHQDLMPPPSPPQRPARHARSQTA